MALDNIRGRVITALGDTHFAHVGILAVQLQMMEQGQSARFSEKAMRQVEIDGYTFLSPADVVSYREGKKYKTSSAPIAEIDFATASWRRAILLLNGYERNWVLFAYGNSLNYQTQSDICFYVWDTFETEHKAAGFKKMNAATLKIMRRLTFYCIQEIRYGLLGLNISDKEEPEKKAFEEDRKISVLLGISIESWRKSYKKRWQIMKKVCLDLDELSLLSTTRIRNEHISRNRYRNPDMPVSSGMAQKA